MNGHGLPAAKYPRDAAQRSRRAARFQHHGRPDALGPHARAVDWTKLVLRTTNTLMWHDLAQLWKHLPGRRLAVGNVGVDVWRINEDVARIISHAIAA